MKKLFILLILQFPFLAAFSQTGEKVYCIWEIAEKPEFLGGDSAMYAFLHETIRYPLDAQEKKISGTVVVAFTIERDGSVNEVRAENIPVYSEIVDIDGVETKVEHEATSLVDEAIRGISLMPKWKPGTIGEEKETVRVHFTIPVCFQFSGTEDEKIYTIDDIEVQPEFPGGESAMYEWMSKKLVYPDHYAEISIAGTVVAQVVIEKDGLISDIKVVKSLDPPLDKEVIRVVSMMPKWNPGKHDGQSVRVAYKIPVKFQLK